MVGLRQMGDWAARQLGSSAARQLGSSAAPSSRLPADIVCVGADNIFSILNKLLFLLMVLSLHSDLVSIGQISEDCRVPPAIVDAHRCHLVPTWIFGAHGGPWCSPRILSTNRVIQSRERHLVFTGSSRYPSKILGVQRRFSVFTSGIRCPPAAFAPHRGLSGLIAVSRCPPAILDAHRSHSVHTRVLNGRR
jgi:hypothetical protein